MPRKRKTDRPTRPATPEQLAALARGRAAQEARRSQQSRPAGSPSPRQQTPARQSRPAAAHPSARPARRNSATLTGGLPQSLADELGLPAEAEGEATEETEAVDQELPDELRAEVYGDADDPAARDDPPAAATAQPAPAPAPAPAPSPASLMAVFESAAGREPPPGESTGGSTRQRKAQRRAKRNAKRSAPAATSATPRATPAQKKEQDVEAAAEQWYDGASALFILVMAILLGRELAPTEDQADSIMAPVVRILMRHYDPLRKASADGADVLEAATAAAIYVQAIYPAWAERQQQRRIERNVRRGPIVNSTAQRGPAYPAQRVPIEVNGSRIANPPAAGGYSGAAGGAGGLPASAAGAGGGRDGEGPESGAGLSPESVFAEATGYTF